MAAGRRGQAGRHPDHPQIDPRPPGEAGAPGPDAAPLPPPTKSPPPTREKRLADDPHLDPGGPVGFYRMRHNRFLFDYF